MAASSEISPKRLVKDGYNAIAPAYMNFITKLGTPNIVWADKLLNTIPSPSTANVLEIGCGNGLPVTKHLIGKVGHITANDISTAQIELAKEKLAGHDNVEFLPGDMTTLQLPEETYDAALALYCLMHLPRDEQPDMLRSIHGWLKPGGVLLCNFPEGDEPGTVMEDWLGARMYSSNFDAERSKQMAIDAGFELLETAVVSTFEGKKTVPFLWVLAQKKA